MCMAGWEQDSILGRNEVKYDETSGKSSAEQQKERDQETCGGRERQCTESEDRSEERRVGKECRTKC